METVIRPLDSASAQLCEPAATQVEAQEAETGST